MEDQKKQQPETEKIVSLNEDSKFHQHDDKSFEKLMNEQAKFNQEKSK